MRHLFLLSIAILFVLNTASAQKKNPFNGRYFISSMKASSASLSIEEIKRYEVLYEESDEKVKTTYGGGFFMVVAAAKQRKFYFREIHGVMEFIFLDEQDKPSEVVYIEKEIYYKSSQGKGFRIMYPEVKKKILWAHQNQKKTFHLKPE